MEINQAKFLCAKKQVMASLNLPLPKVKNRFKPMDLKCKYLISFFVFHTGVVPSRSFHISQRLCGSYF